MNQEAQPRVGFFRGMAAVLRATVHAFGLVLSFFGRAVAAVTRRTRRTSDTPSRSDDQE